MYATLVASANDAAHALSRTTGLSKEQFVAKMNEKAKEIGMENTNFIDPTGIEVDNNSTAQDIVKMLDYALDNYYMIRKLTTTSEKRISTMAGEIKRLENTNKLLIDPNLMNPFWNRPEDMIPLFIFLDISSRCYRLNRIVIDRSVSPVGQMVTAIFTY